MNDFKGLATADRLAKIDDILRERYPRTTALEFASPWKLLVATVLAAQCTDERVNKVTKTLFDRFADPAAFAGAELEELEDAVHSTGFYKQKAKSLKAMNTAIVEEHGGQMPQDMEALVKLPGVGRKTANLVLGNALGVPAVIVDTHVKRLSLRLGFTAQTNPDKIEAELVKLIDASRQTAFSNLLTYLGRDACKAKKPRCEKCPVAELCPRVGVETPEGNK